MLSRPAIRTWRVCAACQRTLPVYTPTTGSSHALRRVASTAIPRPYAPTSRELATVTYARKRRRLAARQHFATVSSVSAQSNGDSSSWGPLDEYDRRVQSNQLQDDTHQRTIVQSLQDLHDMLREYHPPAVKLPGTSSRTSARGSFFGRLFGGGGSNRDDSGSSSTGGGAYSASGRKLQAVQLPPGTPKGLYMYGDVGSGKTMLMDLFYDTLPPHIQHKRRIHFHNFMQQVHRVLHTYKTTHDSDEGAMAHVAAEIAQQASVLCFDEFQCTDVADAMILRGLLEQLLSHGVVLVTTSNRHPDELYKNGIQRQSFIPCINLLKTSLRVINLDSATDYRKVPRPPSGVYHHPLDRAARNHAQKWFEFLGDVQHDPPHATTLQVWGRDVEVPLASGDAAMFTFDQLLGRATGAADYIELTRCYHALVVTDVPGMTHRSRDLARRFITFIDAVYESRAKLVLTTAVPLHQLFMSADEIDDALEHGTKNRGDETLLRTDHAHDGVVDDVMRQMMDDLGVSMSVMQNSGLFSGDEERFAFARALSRLSEMGSQEWVERGLGMEHRGGQSEREGWQRVRSRMREDM